MAKKKSEKLNKEKKRNSRLMERKSGKKLKRWERFDNTAHLFPIIATDDMSNVYRISVNLTEDVNSQLLQQALNVTLPHFPGFNMRMRKGFFWFYFEENTKPAPDVSCEDTYPCQFIVENRNRNYQFRVTYYKKRINMEVFHALTDGMGTINFLRELTYQYLRLLHPEHFTERNLCSDTSLNREDSFMRNYRKKQPKPYQTEKAFLIKGDKIPKNHLAVMHGYLQTGQLKRLCKKYDCSINELLVATFAYSVYKEYNLGGKPVRIAVPVNLRPYFESVTTKNFFVMVSAELKPEEVSQGRLSEADYDGSMPPDLAFEEVVTAIRDSLRSQVNKEYLEKLFSYNVSNQMNIVARAVPLPLKNIAIRSVFVGAALANTSTVTNIGNIKVEPEYEPFIESFHAILPMSKGQDLKGTVCSYGGTLTFTFSSRLEETHVQRRFFRTLAVEGLDVRIETNGEYED